MSEVLDLTKALCERASVTPDDAGCQALLAERLAKARFTTESLRFGDVDNLWAWHGTGSPVTVFLGHTDVVPTGPADQWRSPPFEPAIRDGKLYARGAADMKGSVAAMTLALARFVREHPSHAGTVGLLVTSDEEGDARDGVRRVVETFMRRNQRIDYCVVGEPSSREKLGDQMRVGRRGSLHGHLRVRGVQGHVAFPENALNPIHVAAPALAELAAKRYGDASANFPATSFQISNITSGTGALNVIPGELKASFNFRFNPASRPEALMQAVEAVLVKHALDYRIEWDLSGSPYHTPAGALTKAVTAAVREVCGIEPEASTGGGTSDGRFVATMGSEVVELGPVNATIHKVDEHVAVEDLDQLVEIYLAVLRRLAAR